MDETTCARILWATTSKLRTSSGHEEEVRKARGALAAILRAGARAGFPAPLEPGRAERGSPAWKECVAVARNPTAPITPATAPPMFALLWAGDKAGVTTRPADGHGLSWPKAAGTMPETIIGPMQDGAGRELYLFLYRDIDTKAALEEDGDCAPGIYPRGTRVAAPLPLAPAIAGTTPDPELAAPWAGGWAWILLAASIIFAGLALVWVYGAAEFARAAVGEVRLGTVIDREVARGALPAGNRRDLFPAMPEANPAMPATWVDDNGRLRLGDQAAVGLVVAGIDGKPTVHKGGAVATAGCLAQLGTARVAESVALDRAACGRLWRNAWANQVPSAARGDNWWKRTLASLWGPTNVDRQLSLLWPLGLAALSVVTLILGAGVATRRYLLGALIDERDRMSLSRLQQLAWTVVLFGGFTVLGLFNIALLASFVRDLGQGEAARAISPDATASQVAALPEF